ncbi:MAG: hypothetical protein C0403_17945, partial [Desulfobacterium sp.]|nr:hypothetical protein [Desulfobacterium sp.]
MLRSYLFVSSSVVILLITILFHGCSPQTRYRVLTFFFTGVPPMEKEDSIPVEVLQPEIQKTQVQKIVYYSHKFFEDGDCGKCHGTTIRFSTPVSGADRKRIFRKGMEMPGPLLMPAEKICVACHEDKSKNWLEKERLWLHTPAAQGRCVVCHHAHQSSQPFLLLYNREKLCGVCHAGKKCAGNESHAQNA